MAYSDYQVGWICALSQELAASRAMLDKVHALRQPDIQDKNIYCLGEIGHHKVVIACLPAGRYGTDSAANVAKDMLRSFPSIKFGLLVGIGGGVPSETHDIRLGDVVVSMPEKHHGGVINYDMGKLLKGGGFERKGHLNKPPVDLLNALSYVKSSHYSEEPKLNHFMGEALRRYPRMKADYTHPGRERDRLYESECDHRNAFGEYCECPEPQEVTRIPRAEEGPKVHYGLIGSGQKVIASIKERNELQSRDGILCFEMEAAGLMDNFPCLVIRGISDYADSYKHDEWQPYAALAAAAFAKEILQTVPKSPNLRSPERISPGKHQPDYNFGLQLIDAPQIDEAMFVGRQKELDFLSTYLLPSTGTASQKRVIIYGLGGMGKTQLAIEFARRSQDEFNSIFWFKAHDEDTLKTSLTTAARRIPQIADSTYELTSDDQENQLIQKFLAWLSQPDNSNWLIIFDNYDNPFMPGQPNDKAFKITNYFPYRSHGSVLVTTQNSRVNFGKRLSVKKFDSSKEGLEILARRSERKDLDSDQDAGNLILRLDGLPLALATAGDYLNHTPVSCGEYLQIYNEFWNEFKETAEELPDYEGRTLYNTWNMSLVNVSAHFPEATDLLQFLSYFDSREIWFELLQGQQPTSFEWHRVIFQNKTTFRAAMRKLQEFSLVEVHHNSDHYSLHSCVQDWIFWQLNGKIRHDLCALALHCIAKLAPALSQDFYWITDRRLEPHALKLSSDPFWQCLNAELAEEVYLDLNRLAETVQRCGKAETAEKFCQCSLNGLEKVLGPDHISTLLAAHDLGFIFFATGRPQEAETLYRRALTGYDKLFGPSCPTQSRLLTINNLGIIYQHQGRLAEAQSMYQEVLDGSKESSEFDPLFTLRASNNLGTLLQRQGNLSGAENMYLEALNGYEKTIGSHHTLTLQAANNLGCLYRDQGKLKDAETMHQRALTGYQKTLGSTHAAALDTKVELAYLHHKQRRMIESERMYHQALFGYYKSLGPEHNSTQIAFGNLLSLYQDKITEEVREISQWEPLKAKTSIRDLAEQLYSNLTGLITMCEFFKDFIGAFGLLGRNLMWLRYFDSAAVAFQQQNRMKSDAESYVDNAVCDICDQWMDPLIGRHICQTCRDVDLCTPCYQKYESGEANPPECKDHPFFLVPCDAASHWDTLTRTSWLQNLKNTAHKDFSSHIIELCGGQTTEDLADLEFRHTLSSLTIGT